MKANLSKERFEADVKDHEMTILQENGLYRHVRFSRPNTSNMRFDLVTYPGYLCYSGDMGCYVFSRISDMFDFFRHKGPSQTKYQIDFRYWAEKCQAVDRDDGIRRFSPDVFDAKIDERFREFIEDQSLPASARELLASEIEITKARARDSRDLAYQALETLAYNGHPIFPDFWEMDCTEYTHRFLWCCYALVWGIAKYYGDL